MKSTPVFQNQLGREKEIDEFDDLFFSGDVSLHRFGLEDIEYEVLERDIDITIHCAASVNLVLPYSALRRSNVDATFNVVSFCNSKKLKPLHYIR